MARPAPATREVPAVSLDEFDVQAREYVHLKSEESNIRKRLAALKDKIMERLVLADDDADGHQTVDVDIPGASALQRQRRVSSKMDPVRAEEILRGAGVWERCAPPVPVVQEDQIYACLYEGLLSEDDVFEMFPQTITYALVVKK